MKVYPWHLNQIPYGLYSDGIYRSEESDTITEQKLRALLKINKKDQEIECDKNLISPETKKNYLTACELLKIDPQIRMMWQVAEKQVTKGYFKEVADHITWSKKRLEDCGYEKKDIEKKIKTITSGAKSSLKKQKEAPVERYTIGRRNWEKMHGSEQNAIYNVISNISYAVQIGHTEPLKLTSKNKQEVAEGLSAIIKGSRGQERKRLENRVNKIKEFYVDGLDQKVRIKELEPPVTIFLVRSIDAETYDAYENCFISEGNKRYQKFKAKKTPSHLREKELYIDVTGALARSEEVIFNEAERVWTEAPPGERWLCTNPRPTPTLLGYHQQPRDVSEEKKEKYKVRKHRIGFEVEFDTPYNKGSCIRNSEGRPLTPVRVLDDYGWALCPDSSVGGGELKSPIIYFRNSESTEQILDQIPVEIQDFINMVNKGEACGGHLNYSTNTMTAIQAMSCIMSWGFVFPLMYPERVNGKANKNGRNYRTFNAILDPQEKYQWLRLKTRCVEVRVFPAHWDVRNIMWRAKLLALMVEDALAKSKSEASAHGPAFMLVNNPYYELDYIYKAAQKNWNEFRKDKSNPIREHVISSVGLNQLKQELKSHASMIHNALGIETEDLATIE